MAGQVVQRKLAAIVAVDVAGYSLLMGRDEVGTLSRLKSLLSEVLEPTMEQRGGRIFKTMGDGALVEFASAVEAVRSAIEVQDLLANKAADDANADTMKLRIGISLGDVIVDGDDLYGNGVNVASRMENLAEPGGICISGNVQEHLKGDSEFNLVSLGPCEVKNISAPVDVYQVQLDWHPTEAPASGYSVEQSIRFCTTPDGVQIAHATIGQGRPVVIVSNWLTHLELDMQLPARRKLIEMLAADHQVIRYDARGSGLSDRDVSDISLEASVTDLDTVINDLGLERVSLIGQSQGAAIASVYAARYPDVVERLVLYGGYARGRRMRGSEGQIAESDAFVTMIRQGWGTELDAYVRMFGSFFMPDANSDQLAVFTNLQRKATPPDNAARIQLALDNIDITKELASVNAPTLVLHVREDARAPFEEGRRLAAGIPNARFVPLEGRNHIMLADDPSLKRFLEEVGQFLSK